MVMSLNHDGEGVGMEYARRDILRAAWLEEAAIKIEEPHTLIGGTGWIEDLGSKVDAYNRGFEDAQQRLAQAIRNMKNAK